MQQTRQARPYTAHQSLHLWLGHNLHGAFLRQACVYICFRCGKEHDRDVYEVGNGPHAMQNSGPIRSPKPHVENYEVGARGVELFHDCPIMWDTDDLRPQHDEGESKHLGGILIVFDDGNDGLRWLHR